VQKDNESAWLGPGHLVYILQLRLDEEFYTDNDFEVISDSDDDVEVVSQFINDDEIQFVSRTPASSSQSGGSSLNARKRKLPEVVEGSSRAPQGSSKAPFASDYFKREGEFWAKEEVEDAKLRQQKK
jgi:hypothetical protein